MPEARLKPNCIAALWSLCITLAVLAAPIVVAPAEAQAQTISQINVEGNRRVERETVLSYLQFNVGDRYDPFQFDQSINTLFETGLFSDVRVRRNRSVVTVVVTENPIINRVVFEGNSEIDDATLAAEVQLKPRSIFTRARVQADVQRILDVYSRQGRFNARIQPQIIRLAQNRIDLVFEIAEGEKTTVESINFVGNGAFSDSQLEDVITTTETGLLSFLKPTNIYDPDRLNLDRELLRQFYLKNGYADAVVLATNADLDIDGSGFFITFTIEEGERYTFGDISVSSDLPDVDTSVLDVNFLTETGDTYDAAAVEKTVEALTLRVAQQGYAFARVR
ncbi:MAG: outer membrane protein assembly factor BamA, partial [Pseudomonadota bacterium]